MGGFKAQRNGGMHGRISQRALSAATTGAPLAQKNGKPVPPQVDDLSLIERQGGIRRNGYQVRELTLDMLASEANQRYAQHLRLAYEALVEVERERGLYYGDTLSDLLAACLEQAECEVYGPKGLLGAE